jgi:hypothetical protein
MAWLRRGAAAGLTAWTEAKPASCRTSDAPPDSSDWNDFWEPTGGIQHATQGLPRCPRLQNLVRRGVPPDQRAALWRLCAAPGHPGHYDALLEQQQAEGASAASRQIDKDLHRTFGGVPEVRVPQQEALASLRNVLTACASRARPARPRPHASKPPHRPAACLRRARRRKPQPRGRLLSVDELRGGRAPARRGRGDRLLVRLATTATIVQPPCNHRATAPHPRAPRAPHARPMRASPLRPMRAGPLQPAACPGCSPAHPSPGASRPWSRGCCPATSRATWP